jgi:hypothetical protein
MPTQIKINTLSGLSPFDVYTCDTGYTSCIYVATITSGQIPYIFTIPFIQEGMNPIGLKVMDSANCIIEENLTL